MGFGFLTKATVYLMAPVIGVALLWHYRRDWQPLLRRGLQIFVPALLLGSLFWSRNAIVYGGFDVMAKAAHDAVVVGQPRTATWIADYGLQETVRRFLQTTFNSFLGTVWLDGGADAGVGVPDFAAAGRRGGGGFACWRVGTR
jgi:4-amino-4-deoxy-L-arabinose transferase-like glycosyltransferase